MDELCGSKVFSKIDLRNDNYYIQIKEHEKWKTTFKLKAGLFQWLVLIFILSKASRIFRGPYFSKFMVDLLRDNEVSITFSMAGLTPHSKNDHLENDGYLPKVYDLGL